MLCVLLMLVTPRAVSCCVCCWCWSHLGLCHVVCAADVGHIWGRHAGCTADVVTHPAARRAECSFGDIGSFGAVSYKEGLRLLFWNKCLTPSNRVISINPLFPLSSLAFPMIPTPPPVLNNNNNSGVLWHVTYHTLDLPLSYVSRVIYLAPPSTSRTTH